MDTKQITYEQAIEQMNSGKAFLNAAQIRSQATRVVVGRIPAQARKELQLAVRLGLLGHLKKDGLKPEVFFHPDHKNGAIKRQCVEATYAIGCIASVIATPSQVRAGLEAQGIDVLAYALNERSLGH